MVQYFSHQICIIASKFFSCLVYITTTNHTTACCRKILMFWFIIHLLGFALTYAGNITFLAVIKTKEVSVYKLCLELTCYQLFLTLQVETFLDLPLYLCCLSLQHGQWVLCAIISFFILILIHVSFGFVPFSTSIYFHTS